MRNSRHNPRSTQTVRLALTLMTAILAVGCSGKPNAPALQDGPVYQNKQEGFHFLVPEGWNMRGRGEFPPGKLSEELLLVEYRRALADKPASLEVTMNDFGSSKPLAECVESRGLRPDDWRPLGSVEQLTIGGQPAVRLAFASRLPNDDTCKEIVAVRRQERVYFFTTIYQAADPRARDEARRAATSLVWDN